MTSTIQRAELQAQIWKIANDVRGSVDGWDFKQFVLGTRSIALLVKTLSTILRVATRTFSKGSVLLLKSSREWGVRYR